MGPDYVSVLSWNPSTGLLHLHVVIAASEYMPHKLVAQKAREVGLGSVHVSRIGTTANDRHNIANYMRANLLPLREAPKVDGQRLRPFNPSRSWPGGTLTRPAWREQAQEGRRLIVVGFTRDGVPWARPMKGEQEADELLEAS